MTDFGESYRKEVEDVNEGRSQAGQLSSAQKVSRASAGKQTTTLDTRGKFDGFAEFASAAGSTLTGIKKREDQSALDRAYADGSQEKLDALQEEEGGFFQNIFGKSATMKGFENRVIDNEVEQDYQNRLQQIGEHAKQFKSIDDYRKNVGDPLLKQALEKQSDPDVKARITNAFTKNTKLLAGQFVKHRKAYEQVLNKKQVLTNVLSASRTMKLAEASSDDKLQRDAKSRMGKAVQKPRDMDEQAWENTLTSALVDRIGNGDLSVLQVMEADDKLTFFSIQNKNKIDQAKDIYTRENDTRFLTKDLDLQQMILRQDDNFVPALAAYKKQYPQVDSNRYARAFEEQRIKADAAAQILHQDKLDVLSGTSPAAPKDSVRKANASRAAYDQLADDAFRMNLGETIRQQQLDGQPTDDINTVASAAQKESALMAAPQGLVNVWRTSGVAPTLVTKSLHELDNLILSDELTVDDEPRVEQLTQFLNSFNENPNDAALFAKNVKSKQQLANFKQLNFLMNGTGRATRESLVMMRLNRAKPIPEFDPIQTQQFANEALRDFTDSNGFENWLGWSSNPDNQEDLELAAATAFDEALEVVKNPAEAKRLVQDFLTYDSTRVGDKFVLGGADLDTNSYGGSYNEYVEVVQESEQWKSKQAAAGFPRDRLITDPRNTITVFPNGRGAVITSFDGNGNTVYTDLPTPTNRHDYPSTQPERRDVEPLDFNEPVPAPDVTPDAPQPTERRKPTAGKFQDIKNAIANVETAHGAASDKAYNQGKNSSGYEGKYQFRYRDKRDAGFDIATKLGIDPKGKKSPFEQEAIMDEYLKQNARSLVRKGIEPTQYHLWLAHNQGVGGANAILNGKLTKTIRRNIRNQGVSGDTDAELISNYHKKFQSKFK